VRPAFSPRSQTPGKPGVSFPPRCNHPYPFLVGVERAFPIVFLNEATASFLRTFGPESFRVFLSPRRAGNVPFPFYLSFRTRPASCPPTASEDPSLSDQEAHSTTGVDAPGLVIDTLCLDAALELTHRPVSVPLDSRDVPHHLAFLGRWIHSAQLRLVALFLFLRSALSNEFLFSFLAFL